MRWEGEKEREREKERGEKGRETALADGIYRQLIIGGIV